MQYYLNDKHHMIIEDYNKQKAFTSFLPGIAGLKGIPLWSFYVNRGQGICSFGVEDKNSPIMEFFPANQAYQYVETYGFRTFIQIEDGEIYEPFQSNQDKHIKRSMEIGSGEFSIHEVNEALGLSISITYFGMPNEDFGALVRDVKVESLDGSKRIKILDGIASIMPFGVKNSDYKEMGNLFRSWMEVGNLDNKLPFYKMRASTDDTVEVSEITKGHFYLSFNEDGSLLMPIVDPAVIFGENTSFTYPDNFKQIDFSAKSYEQYTTNKVPCGFSPLEMVISKDLPLKIHTMIGHSAGVELIEKQLDRLLSESYVEKKRIEAGAIIDEMLTDIETKTGKPIFDAYLKQSYLDNLLRGGYPIQLKGNEKTFNYYVYSRKHGDPEREYNFFRFAPEFYSNGEGNFRDVNQNRRSDVVFNPSIGTHNVKLFMNLMQLDGNNPLVVENSRFKVAASDVDHLIQKHLVDHKNEIKAILDGFYTPGHLVSFLHEQTVEFKTSEAEFFKDVLDHSEQTEGARHGEGFWSDHFTYNIDLIESYLAVYPDQLETLLIEDKTYKFYDSQERVLARSDKYVKTKQGNIRQYGSVVEDHEKLSCLNMVKDGTNWAKAESGQGIIYKTNLLVKLLSLASVKLSMLDPLGMGIEMDANKPGWNDALNGLPGLIGSGLSETIEVKRIFEFIDYGLDRLSAKAVDMPLEIENLIVSLQELLNSGDISDFEYWDTSASIREAYRNSIRCGLVGEVVSIQLEYVHEFVKAAIDKLNQGIEKAIKMGDGIPPTFFKYEVTAFEMEEDIVIPKAFECHPLPLFLEAPARLMKTNMAVSDARKLHEKIKASDIYDKKLMMYKTSEPIDEEGHDIGRIRAFTAGWLERESVFLHMTYKYLLGLMKAGLYEEFYEAMKTNFVPFMKPEVYGRSILENSSFIASSVNPDPNVHGRGFVSRLSGSNAEVLDIWYHMMIGQGGFKFDEEENTLSFVFAPIIDKDYFDETGSVTFKFLSHTEVVYKNTKKKATFGKDGVKAVKLLVELDDKTTEIEGDRLNALLAQELRDRKIDRITVILD